MVAARGQPVPGHAVLVAEQRTAILQQAKNSTAAKLFLDRQLSTEMQNGSFKGWPVRTDVTPRQV